MNKLAVVCVVAAVIGGVMSANGEASVSYAEDATVAESLVLSGEYIIDVAADVTVTYTGEISGTGPLRKTGAGTLVLNPSGGPNTFTAGVQTRLPAIILAKEKARATSAPMMMITISRCCFSARGKSIVIASMMNLDRKPPR